ncbi:MAG: Low-specificity L-threonine aldolase [Acidimicrobiales bacterium]|nr:Low-specificity L-threonine aldolase [Acidimicrobiales bacterium]
MPVPDPSASDDRAAAAAVELVEEVEADGTVLRVVSRAEMRTRRLRHRCTYIAVVDNAGQLVVHQRAAWKDVWPSRWDLAFGGVVGVGEPWDLAARRELAEEAGIDAPLELLGAGPVAYDDAEVHVVGQAYLAHHDGPFTFPDGEVVASDRVPLADLDAWLTAHQTCPDAVTLVAPHLRRLGGHG